MTAKNTILWTLLTDPTAEVIVLDPEREYINVAREMDGEVVQISGDSHTYINRSISSSWRANSRSR